MLKVSTKKNYSMINLAKELFPIHRSITGDGFLKSLKIIQKIIPDLKINSIRSGTKVFDWIVPDEWNIKNAYIQSKSGKKFAEFKKNNLHVVGYSKPINRNLNLKELKKKIYTIPNKPNWIPYITSYYKKDWGFCMSENEKKNLKDGDYKVFIDSSFKKGCMRSGEFFIKGEKKDEIFFSTYLCHPSMANNEISGPVIVTELAKYVKDNFKKTKFSYRFLFLPETIGAIAYISKNLSNLKKNVFAGYVISCVGDNRSFSHIKSRKENTIADKSIKAALLGKKNVKEYSFLDRGSDERQYCSPGVDLPVCGFSRSKYASFPEYHSSADNFDLVTHEGLKGSLEVLKSIINTYENGLVPKMNIKCEPQLGRRNLHPSVKTSHNHNKEILLRLNLVAYSDGTLNAFELSELLNVPLNSINAELKLLYNEKIISFVK